MTVAQTSRQSHLENEATGRSATQRVAICMALREHGEPMTRREISVQTGYETSAVSGRVNELVGIEYLRDAGSRKCNITGRMAKTVWFNNAGGSEQ